MTDDLMSIKTETLNQCIKAEASWELLQGKVAEGPSLLKKNGVYYLIYSANHYENKDMELDMQPQILLWGLG